MPPSPLSHSSRNLSSYNFVTILLHCIQYTVSRGRVLHFVYRIQYTVYRIQKQSPRDCIQDTVYSIHRRTKRAGFVYSIQAGSWTSWTFVIAPRESSTSWKLGSSFPTSPLKLVHDEKSYCGELRCSRLYRDHQELGKAVSPSSTKIGQPLRKAG